MGCCVSAAASDDRRDKNRGGLSTVSDKNRLPPAIVEEETVKEVLSETTMLTSSKDEPVIENKTQKPAMEKIRKDEEKPEILKAGKAQIPGRPESIVPNPEDGSEVSEICSLSVSESVSSTVVNPHEDGDDEVKQMKMHGMRPRSPVKPRTRVSGNNYPTRKFQQSPVKRSVGGGTGSVRLVNPTPGRRSGSGMKDPAERSGRRSRSPAMNRSATNPVPGAGPGARRKNSESPCRVRTDPGKSVPEQPSQWPSCGAAGNYNSAPRESLENPLVSLECFIFL